jgi:uncharacterized protein YbaP (TraB family)
MLHGQLHTTMNTMTFARLVTLCLALLCGLSRAAGADAPTTAIQTADCPPVATPSADMMRAAIASGGERGPLWRISKDGHASFLYGTLHVGKALWYAPGPLMLEALKQTDVLALELDPLDPAVQAEMAAQLAAAPQVRLAPATQARLARAWQRECLPAAALDGGPAEMKAVAVSLLGGRRQGLDPAYGSEIMLSAVARGSSRPVVSLETVATQLDLILGKSSDEVEAMVRDLLDELDADPNRVKMMRMVDAWAAADMAELAAYEQWCDCIKSDADRTRLKRMLGDRNPGLAHRIDDLHASGRRVFAAVGALHMTGATALPALLAARGYEVQRLR